MSLDQLVSVGGVIPKKHAGPDVILFDYIGEGDVDPVVAYFYVVDILSEGGQVADCAVVVYIVDIH